MVVLLASGSAITFATSQPLVDASGRTAGGALVTFACDAVTACVAAALAAAGCLDPTSAAGLLAGKWVLVGTATYWLVRDVWRPGRVRIDRGVVSRLARSAAPLWVALTLGLVPVVIVSAAVEAYHGSATYAIFAVGGQAASAYLVLVMVGTRVLQADLAGRWPVPRAAVWRLVMRTGAAAVVLLVGALGTGVVLIDYLLDPFYSAARWPLVLQLVGAFATGVGMMGVTLLVVHQNERAATIGQAVGVVVAAVAAATLVPPMGATGGAFAICIASVASATVTSFLASRSIATMRWS